MSRLRRLFLLFLVLGLIPPTATEAQTSVKVGPRVGIPAGDIHLVGGDLFVGGEARIETAALPVVINPSFDYYLMDERRIGGSPTSQSLFRVDVNALYPFGDDNGVFSPYAGGGLGITRYSYDADPRNRRSKDTEVGLNLVGGGRFHLGRVEPFAQLSAAVLDDWDRLGLTAGVVLRL